MPRLLLSGGLTITLVQPAQMIGQRDAQHDFDFEIGAWKAHVSRLEQPLTGSSRWLD